MKNAAFVILSVALGVWVVSCEKQDVKPEESLSLEVRRDSITDFASFLEAISLMVSEQPVTLQLLGDQPERKLAFVKYSDGPGCPVLVRVSPDSIDLGSGTSQMSMTLEQLGSQMRLFKAAATAASAPASLMLHSERNVSGEFGLLILGVLADSGIDFVVLTEPDRHQKTPSSDADRPKPKPPSPWDSGSRIVR